MLLLKFYDDYSILRALKYPSWSLTDILFSSMLLWEVLYIESPLFRFGVWLLWGDFIKALSKPYFGDAAFVCWSEVKRFPKLDLWVWSSFMPKFPFINLRFVSSLRWLCMVFRPVSSSFSFSEVYYFRNAFLCWTFIFLKSILYLVWLKGPVYVLFMQSPSKTLFRRIWSFFTSCRVSLLSRLKFDWLRSCLSTSSMVPSSAFSSLSFGSMYFSLFASLKVPVTAKPTCPVLWRETSDSWFS